MRRLKNILVLMLILCFAVPSFGERVIMTKEKGSFLRSLELITTINANYDERSKMLTVLFYGNYGEVVVSVEDEQGNTVHWDFIYVTMRSEISVPLKSISAGRYKLSITVVGESPMEGWFEAD